ncbi:hypothetical protein CB452P1_000058 [Clostridium phage CB452P1]|nr:hypothetical protein CB452P1_000058 [Clostridium phage CB452P1]
MKINFNILKEDIETIIDYAEEYQLCPSDFNLKDYDFNKCCEGNSVVCASCFKNALKED